MHSRCLDYLSMIYADRYVECSVLFIVESCFIEEFNFILKFYELSKSLILDRAK